MIKVGNASLETIPGKDDCCSACDFKSATLYKIRVGDTHMTLCPLCLGNLEHVLQAHADLHDGY